MLQILNSFILITFKLKRWNSIRFLLFFVVCSIHGCWVYSTNTRSLVTRKDKGEQLYLNISASWTTARPYILLLVCPSYLPFFLSFFFPSFLLSLLPFSFIATSSLCLLPSLHPYLLQWSLSFPPLPPFVFPPIGQLHSFSHSLIFILLLFLPERSSARNLLSHWFVRRTRNSSSSCCTWQRIPWTLHLPNQWIQQIL